MLRIFNQSTIDLSVFFFCSSGFLYLYYFVKRRSISKYYIECLAHALGFVGVFLLALSTIPAILSNRDNISFAIFFSANAGAAWYLVNISQTLKQIKSFKNKK
jgi:hypothetical protein